MNSPSRKNTFGKPREGFTLIELLTVIAIIGILAAIIIPTVGKVRDSAKASQCVSNLRQGCVALRLYATENKGFLPEASIPATPPATGNVDWSQAIEVYLPSVKNTTARSVLLQCPASDYRAQMDDGGFTEPAWPIARTYSMGPGSGGINSFNNDTNPQAKRNLASVRNPSIAIWLMESKLSLNSLLKYGLSVPSIGKNQLYTSITAPTTTLNDSASPVSWWHGGKNRTNVAFGDGSVRGFTAPELLDRYPNVNTNAGWQKAAGF